MSGEPHEVHAVRTHDDHEARKRALQGAARHGAGWRRGQRCASCGEYEVAIPAIDELDRTLASAVIRKPARLSGAEVRFLRSYLGYSGADFAKLIGSDPATVSRWEGDKQAIGHHTDLLLRAMVVLDAKVDAYPIATFGQISDGAPTKPRYAFAFKPAASRWKPTELRAA